MLQLARMQGCSYLGYIHPIYKVSWQKLSISLDQRKVSTSDFGFSGFEFFIRVWELWCKGRDIFRGWEPFIKVLLNNYFLQQTCIVWVQEVASNRFAHPNLSHMKMPKLAAWSNRGGKRAWEAKRERRGLCWLKRFLCGRTCGWLACEMSGIVQVWLSHAAGRLSLLCIYLQPISRICDWNWKMQQVSGWKSKGHFAFPSL